MPWLLKIVWLAAWDRRYLHVHLAQSSAGPSGGIADQAADWDAEELAIAVIGWLLATETHGGSPYLFAPAEPLRSG